MKLFETSHIFHHSWDNVTSAIWRKYPNDNAPHIIHIETIQQHVSPETGKLFIERLIVAKDKMPRFLAKLLGGVECHYVREVIEIDPSNKTFTAKSKNLTFNNVLSIQETVQYERSDDLSKTIFRQEAQFNAEGSLRAFAHYVEDFCIKGFQQKAEMGRRAMEQVIEMVMRERQGFTTPMLQVHVEGAQ